MICQSYLAHTIIQMIISLYFEDKIKHNKQMFNKKLDGLSSEMVNKYSFLMFS